MATTTYKVTGMTCGHCVNAVTSELTGLSAVSGVTVDLVPDGISLITVTSEGPLPPEPSPRPSTKPAATSSQPDHTHRQPSVGESWHVPETPPTSRGHAPDKLRDRLVEAAGAGLLDEDRELVRAHLHPLAEVVGDDDLPFRWCVMIDEQLRAAAAALAAEQGESGRTLGAIHDRAPFLERFRTRAVTRA